MYFDYFNRVNPKIPGVPFKDEIGNLSDAEEKY